MKFVYLLAISALCMAAMVKAQNKPFKLTLPKEEPKNLPQLYGGGGGSRKQGFDVSLGAQQKVWESQNKRHSVDVNAGYGQHLGGPYGNSRPAYNGGVGYTYKFGK
ncbi:diptericin-D-like [Calliphora vicina]|uniref:diptericin-D-like n=1 Tax=Calliphora vicina TaxID=7373 RepID=UPI00325B3A8D